jgi:hypothetical protein
VPALDLVVSAPTTYRSWLATNGQATDPASLREYIHIVPGNEGWHSEFKLSSEQVGFQLREAVAALANGRGGEVLVGVDNAGEVVGSTITREALNAELRQGSQPALDWFVLDLVQVVRHNTVVPFPSEPKWAYVLEIRERERPVFVRDPDGNRWALPVRSDSDSMQLDARGAIEWYRHVSRGTILRSCYSELANCMGQISFWRGVPETLPARLPFITKVSEDPSLRGMLTEEDFAMINGKGVQGGRMSGATDLYYKVLVRYEIALKGKPAYARNIPLRDLMVGMEGEFANLDYDIKQALENFSKYIESQGFAV